MMHYQAAFPESRYVLPPDDELSGHCARQHLAESAVPAAPPLECLAERRDYAMKRKIDRNWTITMASASGMPPRTYYDDPSGLEWCNCCEFHDVDPLILGMHWVLTHDCSNEHRHLQYSNRKERFLKAEAMITDFWMTPARWSQKDNSCHDKIKHDIE